MINSPSSHEIILSKLDVPFSPDLQIQVGKEWLALIIHDGSIVASLESGSHSLKNSSVLDTVPSNAGIYFLRKHITAVKWSAGPIHGKDSKGVVLKIMAAGILDVSITDAFSFLSNISGLADSYDQYALESALKGSIQRIISDQVNAMIKTSDIAAGQLSAGPDQLAKTAMDQLNSKGTFPEGGLIIRSLQFAMLKPM